MGRDGRAGQGLARVLGKEGASVAVTAVGHHSLPHQGLGTSVSEKARVSS